jgi:hypothetical protein
MRFTRFSVALTTVAALSVTACSHDLTGLNVNPNSPTVAPATTLFTQAVTSTVGRFNGSFQTLSMTSLFAQHIAQVQYVDEDRGHIRTTNIDGIFTGVYTAELEDFKKAAEIGKEASKTSRPHCAHDAHRQTGRLEGQELLGLALDATDRLHDLGEARPHQLAEIGQMRAGETKTIRWVREKGARVRGQVTWPADQDPGSVLVSLTDPTTQTDAVQSMMPGDKRLGPLWRRKEQQSQS